MKKNDLGLDLISRRMLEQTLLDAMEQVMARGDLLALGAPHAPMAKADRPSFDLAVMVRSHCLQQLLACRTWE